MEVKLLLCDFYMWWCC